MKENKSKPLGTRPELAPTRTLVIEEQLQPSDPMHGSVLSYTIETMSTKYHKVINALHQSTLSTVKHIPYPEKGLDKYPTSAVTVAVNVSVRSTRTCASVSLPHYSRVELLLLRRMVCNSSHLMIPI